MRVYGVALLAVLCAGCASQNVWVRDSTTVAQAQQDLAECRYDSEKRMGAGAQQGALSVNPVNKCMISRGYYLANKQDLEN